MGGWVCRWPELAAALESARSTTRLQLSGIGEYLFTCRDLVLSPCRTRTGGGIRLLVVLVRTWLGDAGSGLMGQRATERVGLGWALLDDGPARKAALAIQTGRATMTMTAYFTTRPVVDIGQSTLLYNCHVFKSGQSLLAPGRKGREVGAGEKWGGGRFSPATAGWRPRVKILIRFKN